MQPFSVLAALRSFPKGTSPGNFGLRPNIFAVYGNTAPAASECLQALTLCVNYFLSGKLDPHAAPWFCGVPLTALIKPSGGFRSIAVGEPFAVLLAKYVVLLYAQLYLTFFFLLARLESVSRGAWKLLCIHCILFYQLLVLIQNCVV